MLIEIKRDILEIDDDDNSYSTESTEKLTLEKSEISIVDGILMVKHGKTNWNTETKVFFSEDELSTIKELLSSKEE